MSEGVAAMQKEDENPSSRDEHMRYIQKDENPARRDENVSDIHKYKTQRVYVKEYQTHIKTMKI